MNHLDPSTHGGPHYAFTATRIHQEDLQHVKSSTSSRYLFPSPRPSVIPQENPHYMMNMNPPISYSYNHSLPSSQPRHIPPSVPNYFIPHSVNNHYLPQYPSASFQDGGVHGFIPGASVFSHEQANRVADGKFESKGQNQECEKKMSDEQLKKDDVFKGSCFSCGGKFHKADDCPSKGAPNDRKKKKMTDKGSCFHCGEKDHWIGDCPLKKKKKMSVEQPKDDDNFRGICYVCRERNHKAEGCPQKKKISDEHLKENDGHSKDGQDQKAQTIEGRCYHCGEENHNFKNCPNKKIILGEQLKESGQGQKAQTIEGPCYRCGEESHKAKNCPQKKKKISDEQLKENGDHQKAQTIEGPCYRCGEENHKAKYCPQKTKKKISDEQLMENDGPDHQQPTHGKSLIGTIIQQMCLMRFDGEGSVCEYILEMEYRVRQLRELKMGVSDDFLVHMVLNSLPQVFDTVKLNYYSSTDLWNVNELIAHCVHEEAKHEQNA